jgi:hypothetical protein
MDLSNSSITKKLTGRKILLQKKRKTWMTTTQGIRIEARHLMRKEESPKDRIVPRTDSAEAAIMTTIAIRDKGPPAVLHITPNNRTNITIKVKVKGLHVHRPTIRTTKMHVHRRETPRTEIQIDALGCIGIPPRPETTLRTNVLTALLRSKPQVGHHISKILRRKFGEIIGGLEDLSGMPGKIWKSMSEHEGRRENKGTMSGDDLGM